MWKDLKIKADLNEKTFLNNLKSIKEVFSCSAD